jgi:hypothetical protein
MSAIQSLHDNLTKAFGLPQSSVEWLLMIYQAIQVFDDVADGDEVTRQELDKTIWNMLVAMHQNKFWRLNQDALSPLLATMVLKWQASDIAERAGKADAKSFVWRAGYYDLVLAVVQICHGPEIAIKMASYVMDLYGEKFEDYMREFKNA